MATTWVANNRVALAESVWLAYLEAKEAIAEHGDPERRLSMLYRAQNAWVLRSALLALDRFDADVVTKLAGASPLEPERREHGQETRDKSPERRNPLIAASSAPPSPFPASRPFDWGSIADLGMADRHTALAPDERRRRAPVDSDRWQAGRERVAGVFGRLVGDISSAEELSSIMEDAPVDSEFRVGGWTASGGIAIVGDRRDSEAQAWLPGDWLDELPSLVEDEARLRLVVPNVRARELLTASAA